MRVVRRSTVSRWRSARSRQRATAGIRFIHQDLGLVDEHDTVDNLALGGSYGSRWWISDRRSGATRTAISHDYGVDLDVSAPLQASRRPARRWSPSSALCDGHRRGRAARARRADGFAHRPGHGTALPLDPRGPRAAAAPFSTSRTGLGEVFEIADRVTVLRDGRRVATEPVAALDHDRLAELIVGPPAERLLSRAPAAARRGRAFPVTTSGAAPSTCVSLRAPPSRGPRRHGPRGLGLRGAPLPHLRRRAGEFGRCLGLLGHRSPRSIRASGDRGRDGVRARGSQAPRRRSCPGRCGRT